MNLGPPDWRAGALPTELTGPISLKIYIGFIWRWSSFCQHYHCCTFPWFKVSKHTHRSSFEPMLYLPWFKVSKHTHRSSFCQHYQCCTFPWFKESKYTHKSSFVNMTNVVPSLDSKRVSILIEAVLPIWPMLYLPLKFSHNLVIITIITNIHLTTHTANEHSMTIFNDNFPWVGNLPVEHLLQPRMHLSYQDDRNRAWPTLCTMPLALTLAGYQLRYRNSSHYKCWHAVWRSECGKRSHHCHLWKSNGHR